MKIDCYISQSCSSRDPLEQNISEAIKQERVKVVVTIHSVSDREAEKLGLKGSPSVLIDGKDILPGTIPGLS